MEEKNLEKIINELDEIIRKYGYYYISEIEIIGKSGNFATVTKQQRNIKI